MDAIDLSKTDDTNEWVVWGPSYRDGSPAIDLSKTDDTNEWVVWGPSYRDGSPARE